MHALRRIGIDGYMVLLVTMVMLGTVVPAKGLAADALKQITFWAVALLFFIYGAKLELSAIRAGLMNWRLQSLSFAATFVLFPVLGLLIAQVAGPVLGPELTLGLLFLSVLPSTVQSSIAFTSIAGGNVAGAICSATLSNLIGVVLTPVLMAVILHQSGGVSGTAMGRIAVQILLPFVVGQCLKPWVGAFIRQQKQLTMVVDRGSILLIVYAAFSAGTAAGIWHTTPAASLVALAVTIAIYLSLAMAGMTSAGRIIGMSGPDRIALFFCGSTKSLASGLPIATALFAPQMVGAIVLPLMLFHILQLLVCAIMAPRMARAALRSDPAHPIGQPD